MIRIVKRRKVRLSRQPAAKIIQRAVRARSGDLVRAQVNVTLGRQNTSLSAALIVHDGTHAFVLSGASPSMPLCFPQSAVAIGTELLDSAVQAFDKFAGPAVRACHAARRVRAHALRVRRYNLPAPLFFFGFVKFL